MTKFTENDVLNRKHSVSAHHGVILSFQLLYDTWRRIMIKISSWICGSCLIVWIIFLLIVCVIRGTPPALSAWGRLSIITAVIVLGSFALSYLGGHIIKGNKGAFRLGVLISVLWVACFFVALEPYNNRYRRTEFIGIGIIPVISYLGILWIISGFLPKTKKMEDS